MTRDPEAGRARAVPDFAIVGAAKAGTTSLHSYLSQHPQISATVPKETFHFVRPEIEACRGVGAGYAPRPIPATLADYAGRFVPPAPDNLRGESCVAYLYFPAAAGRIAAANPDCRIVVMLRDPVQRAFSNYLHHVRDGLEPLDFRAALAASTRRVEQGWWFGFDYIGGSRYATQLTGYCDRFPREHVRVLWYDEFCARPDATCREIFDLVGVDRHAPLDVRAELNVSTIPRASFRPLLQGLDTLGLRLRNVMSRRKYKRLVGAIRSAVSYKPTLSEHERLALSVQFRDDVRQVEHLTGRDLSAWCPR